MQINGVTELPRGPSRSDWQQSARIVRRSAVVLLAGVAALVTTTARAIPPSLPGLPGIIAQGASLTPPASIGPHPCSRPAPGSAIAQPTQIESAHGVLNVHLDFYTDVDANNNSTFCYLLPNGQQGPTLHVKPGDTVNLSVTNHVPPLYPAQPQDLTEPASISANQCGEQIQFMGDPSSMNVHFHGFLVTPRCQADNVAHTVIAAGDTFEYSFPIPANEPPGLYWFHPHVHGGGEQSVQGGGSGTLIVDGIEQFESSVSGLPQRVLVLRDALPGPNVPAPVAGGTSPSWDVSVNYVPVPYTSTTAVAAYAPPGVIEMQANQPELWRVVNSAADAVLDFQVLYDGIPQLVNVVSLDGVPIGSQDGTRKGHTQAQSVISMSPGQRAEFVLAPPGPKVKSAVIQTLNINTGYIGDTDPTRVLARITTQSGDTGLPRLPAYAGATWPQRFEGLDSAAVTTTRKLYFNEVLQNPASPNTSPTNFYVTVEGEPDALYHPDIAPAITTKVGAVEDWTIENRALELHVFHIHQIHFKMQAIDGMELAPADKAYRDDYPIPGWAPPVTTITDASGNVLPNQPYDPTTGTLFANMTTPQQTAYLAKYPYPNFRARFDFRDPTVAGTFVYHCHILAHEDQGMMATISVLP